MKRHTTRSKLCFYLVNFILLLYSVDSKKRNKTVLWKEYVEEYYERRIEEDSKEDINLLAAVGSPLPSDVRPVTGPFGRFGRPAIEFTPQSYVGRWAKDLLPLPFHTDFGIKVTLYLQSIHGGVLFSVLKPDHSEIILGLNILRVSNYNQSIEFIYKNGDDIFGEKTLKATFVLPKFERKWTVFSLAIKGRTITLFFNGCDKIYTKAFKETRTPLNVSPGAPIFIGMAGWYIQKPILFGALYDLTIYKDVKKATPSCAKQFIDDLNKAQHEQSKNNSNEIYLSKKSSSSPTTTTTPNTPTTKTSPSTITKTTTPSITTKKITPSTPPTTVIPTETSTTLLISSKSSTATEQSPSSSNSKTSILEVMSTKYPNTERSTTTYEDVSTKTPFNSDTTLSTSSESNLSDKLDSVTTPKIKTTIEPIEFGISNRSKTNPSVITPKLEDIGTTITMSTADGNIGSYTKVPNLISDISTTSHETETVTDTVSKTSTLSKITDVDTSQDFSLKDTTTDLIKGTTATITNRHTSEKKKTDYYTTIPTTFGGTVIEIESEAEVEVADNDTQISDIKTTLLKTTSIPKETVFELTSVIPDSFTEVDVTTDGVLSTASTDITSKIDLSTSTIKAEIISEKPTVKVITDADTSTVLPTSTSLEKDPLESVVTTDADKSKTTTNIRATISTNIATQEKIADVTTSTLPTTVNSNIEKLTSYLNNNIDSTNTITATTVAIEPVTTSVTYETSLPNISIDTTTPIISTNPISEKKVSKSTEIFDIDTATTTTATTTFSTLEEQTSVTAVTPDIDIKTPFSESGTSIATGAVTSKILADITTMTPANATTSERRTSTSAMELDTGTQVPYSELSTGIVTKSVTSKINADVSTTQPTTFTVSEIEKSTTTLSPDIDTETPISESSIDTVTETSTSSMITDINTTTSVKTTFPTTDIKTSSPSVSSEVDTETTISESGTSIAIETVTSEIILPDTITTTPATTTFTMSEIKTSAPIVKSDIDTEIPSSESSTTIATDVVTPKIISVADTTTSVTPTFTNSEVKTSPLVNPDDVTVTLIPQSSTDFTTKTDIVTDIDTETPETTVSSTLEMKTTSMPDVQTTTTASTSKTIRQTSFEKASTVLPVSTVGFDINGVDLDKTDNFEVVEIDNGLIIAGPSITTTSTSTLESARYEISSRTLTTTTMPTTTVNIPSTPYDQDVSVTRILTEEFSTTTVAPTSGNYGITEEDKHNNSVINESKNIMNKEKEKIESSIKELESLTTPLTSLTTMKTSETGFKPKDNSSDSKSILLTTTSTTLEPESSSTTTDYSRPFGSTSSTFSPITTDASRSGSEKCSCIGQKGERGLSGRNGLQGEQGFAGVPGLNGVKGEKGAGGDKGFKGDKGDMLSLELIADVVLEKLKRIREAEGESLKQDTRELILQILKEEKISLNTADKGNEDNLPTVSLKGEKGDAGDSITGERGSIGLPGLTGLPGAKGERGPKGSQGAHGENGRLGKPGPVGPPGVKGEKGERGTNGQDGLDGSDGEPGPMGLRGAKGEGGDIGLKGEPGQDGFPGKAGAIGAKGDMGELGLTGPPGSKGTKGDAGIGLIGPEGPKGGIGQPGPPGAPGFIPDLLSLKNEKGKDGEKGAKGARGERGFNGFNGSPGMSIKGEKGDPGTSSRSIGKGFKANVIYTVHDLEAMFSLFSIGTFAFVSSTEELFIRSINGWLKVPILLRNSPNQVYSNALLSGPTFDEAKQVLNGPSDLDKRLIESNLHIPPAGVIARRPYLLMVALNEPLDGRMDGVAAADFKCYKQAKQAGLDAGTFRAFLSDTYQNVETLVKEEFRDHPVANIKGDQIFESFSSISNTSKYTGFNPDIPIYSFDLTDVRQDDKWPIKKIWHGSHANGVLHKRFHQCRNWRTNGAHKKGVAASITSYVPALNERLMRCDKKLIVLCIQITLR